MAGNVQQGSERRSFVTRVSSGGNITERNITNNWSMNELSLYFLWPSASFTANLSTLVGTAFLLDLLDRTPGVVSLWVVSLPHGLQHHIIVFLLHLWLLGQFSPEVFDIWQFDLDLASSVLFQNVRSTYHSIKFYPSTRFLVPCLTSGFPTCPCWHSSAR